MFIVTAGKAFNDIDAFACAVAYAQLLRLEGKQALAVFEGPLNHSVSQFVREQTTDFKIIYEAQPDDQFIYVDISDPHQFAYYTEGTTRVHEIFDHHYGWEAFWETRIGKNAHIERVGAAATLIWEEYEKRGFEKQILSEAANLLSFAILQNTLNFKSGETVDRDRIAFEQLGERTNLPTNWQQRYYADMAEELALKFNETMQNDTKIFNDLNLVFSQFEMLSDGKVFFHTFKQQIDEYFKKYPNYNCLVNIADIDSGTSILYSNNAAWFSTIIKPFFHEILEEADNFVVVPLTQRKQIHRLLCGG